MLKIRICKASHQEHARLVSGVCTQWCCSNGHACYRTMASPQHEHRQQSQPSGRFTASAGAWCEHLPCVCLSRRAFPPSQQPRCLQSCRPPAPSCWPPWTRQCLCTHGITHIGIRQRGREGKRKEEQKENGNTEERQQQHKVMHQPDKCRNAAGTWRMLPRLRLASVM